MKRTKKKGLKEELKENRQEEKKFINEKGWANKESKE